IGCSPSSRTGDCRWPDEGGLMAKADRGFASMDRTLQREIASKGGKMAHVKGTAHEWSSDEAREAGRKGGLAAKHRRQDQDQEVARVDLGVEPVINEIPPRADWPWDH